MAKLQAAAQDQVTEATRADILLATSSAYFAVLSAQSVLQVVDETVKTRQTVVDQVTALAESKLRSTLDVSFANVNLSGAKLLQVQAQNELKAAEARLATAMGLPGEPSFVLAEEPMPSAMPDRVQDLIDAAIQNRPELKDLRLQQSAAERLAKAEHALYFPTRRRVGHGRFRPRRRGADTRPLWRHRHEYLHSHFQWRPFQGPPNRSRTEGQGRQRKRQRSSRTASSAMSASPT